MGKWFETFVSIGKGLQSLCQSVSSLQKLCSKGNGLRCLCQWEKMSTTLYQLEKGPKTHVNRKKLQINVNEIKFCNNFVNEKRVSNIVSMSTYTICKICVYGEIVCNNMSVGKQSVTFVSMGKLSATIVSTGKKVCNILSVGVLIATLVSTFVSMNMWSAAILSICVCVCEYIVSYNNISNKVLWINIKTLCFHCVDWKIVHSLCFFYKEIFLNSCFFESF